MPAWCLAVAENYPLIHELIPHAGSAILVDAVVSDSSDAIEVEARITRAHPFFQAPHGVPSWVGVEIMAQASAAHAGLAGWRQHRAPSRGMLLGTRRYRASVPFFTEGMQLLVHAISAFQGSGGAAACHCTMRHEGIEIATATLIILKESA